MYHLYYYDYLTKNILSKSFETRRGYNYARNTSGLNKRTKSSSSYVGHDITEVTTVRKTSLSTVVWSVIL